MKIELNLAEQEAQAYDKDKIIGYCQYEIIEENVWDITHTVVNYAKENNIKLIPTCSYVRKKFDQEVEKYKSVRY